MYERIVVGTDGSERARDAVRRACELAEAFELDEVHVVSATEPFSWKEIERIRQDLPSEFRDVVDADIDADNRIADAKRVLDESAIRTVPYASTADPADAILRVATDIDADLIVVGARGLGAIGRFLRGSVSTKVAHHAPCDVLIVEHDDD
ncbi:MAG: universal stress protein [Actinomycetota bacterium]